MKKLFLTAVLITFFSNVPFVSDDDISISTPRNLIILITRGTIRVPLVIKIKNHKDNRKLRLDWEWGASEKQLNNPAAGKFDGSKPYEIRKEDEYLIFTDEDFRQSTSGPSGLLLPQGQYQIKATLTRIVDGKNKEFTSKLEVTIGITEDK